MLARSAPLPISRGWAYEPKLDGFRCLVDTHDGLRVRSRRAWNVTALLPELEVLPGPLAVALRLAAVCGAYRNWVTVRSQETASL